VTRPKILVCLLVVCFAPAGRAAQQPRDLTEISLEELMNIEVTSVSKKEQKLSQVAAAVYVITQEDIRRSGATSIPEALRMAPGVQVARVNAGWWALSARGFNGLAANKLPVLVDGRSVYSPLFSGVYWEVQDTLLEDVDRIEVIRGPGATMWGANAVNGVINIITKAAAQTQGGLVTAGGGNEERGFGGLRYGGPLGPNAHYRAYAKYFQRNHWFQGAGQGAVNDWGLLRGGFRMDLNLSKRDSLTVQGDVYRGQGEQQAGIASLSPPFLEVINDQTRSAGGNVLGRWKHSSAGSETALQLYYDRTFRKDALTGEVLNTLDLDFQHRRALGSRHDLLWGCGYRLGRDQLQNSFTLSFEPRHRQDHLLSAFLEDDIALLEDRLRLTLGSKFEHNSFTGYEVQPNLRLIWTPHLRHAAWLSVARAVRTPSATEHDLRANLIAFPGANGLPNLLSLFGNRGYRSEELRAYELGYRLQLTPGLFLDLAGFYNFYDHLRSFQAGVPFLELAPAPPHVVIPGRFENLIKAQTRGLEVSATWNATSRWRLSAAYSGLAMRFRYPPGDLGNRQIEGDSPGHQANLRSYLDLTRTVQFDSALYYVGALRQLGVPAYARLDTRLGWRPTPDLELSFVVENLPNNRHLEFIPEGAIRTTEIGRSIHGKITWRF